MAVISGKDGTVNNGSAVANVKSWRITHSSNNSAWASSSTSGYKNRVGGTKDWSGSITVARDVSAVISFVPGTIYSVVLFEDSVSSTTHKYSGNMIVDSVDETVDIDTGEHISNEVSFSGAGVLTLPT